MNITSIWIYVLGSSIALLFLIGLILLIYAIFSFTAVKKRKKHFENLHNNIKVGSEVIFSNGLYGKVKHVYEDFVDIEIKSGVVIKVSRYAISEIIN